MHACVVVKGYVSWFSYQAILRIRLGIFIHRATSPAKFILPVDFCPFSGLPILKGVTEQLQFLTHF